MPAPSLGQIVSTTIENYQRELADQIFKGRRTLKWLYKKGRKKTYEGGNVIRVPLEYAQNPNQKWQGEYDNYTMTPPQIIDAAEFNWLFQTATITHTSKEKVQNDGKHAMIRLAEAKIKNAMKTLETSSNTACFSDGTDVLQPAGFRAMFAATGTYGGISKTSNSWWQGNVDSVSEQLDVDDMRSMYRSCEQETSVIDGIITTRTLIERYEKIAQGFQQIVEVNTADLGFEVLKFKGVPIFYDDSCPASHMFFLTSETLCWFSHPDYDFKAGDMEKSQTQSVWIQPIEFWGNFICTAPRYNGMFTAKTA